MNSPAESPSAKRTLGLAVAALGIVYGDIGTSPLYAMRECFHGPHAIVASAHNVLGVLSVIFWSLAFVISLKYLVYILRADNHGEGGILALMILARSGGTLSRKIILVCGLFGAALLYGDGILTPAISVLSAVEGLEIATPVFKPYIVLITVVILTALFLFQKRGTEGVAALFGPVMAVWFSTLAAVGLWSIMKEPAVLAALDPRYALRFLSEGGMGAFLTLGAIFLVVTGGEALYADLGHFGAGPIRWGWFCFAGPALALNYFGQGALLLTDPTAAVNPFYRMLPASTLLPMVALATCATVIASQALITGVFSLTRQAVQLGFAPRVSVIHTSPDSPGQIYVPAANWVLWLATVLVVVEFKHSSAIASAYGIAVSLTMVITSVLAHFVAVYRWRWNPWLAALATGAFLIVDLAYMGANAAKFFQGGYLPIFAAVAISFVMATWKRGRDALREIERKSTMPLDMFIEEAGRHPERRIPGQAIVLTHDSQTVPSAVLHNFKHNRVLHEKIILLTIDTEEIPVVKEADRFSIEHLPAGFSRVILRYGFMESPDVMGELYAANERGESIQPLTASYIVSRNTVVPGGYGGMAEWRILLFRFLYRNALRLSLYLRLPPDRVVEIGRRVQL